MKKKLIIGVLVATLIVVAGLMAPGFGQQGLIKKIEIKPGALDKGNQITKNLNSFKAAPQVVEPVEEEEEEIAFDAPFLGGCLPQGETDRVIVYDSKDNRGGEYLNYDYFLSALTQEVSAHGGVRPSCPYLIEAYSTQGERYPDVLMVCDQMTISQGSVICYKREGLSDAEVKFSPSGVWVKVQAHLNPDFARLTKKYDFVKVDRVAEGYNLNVRRDQIWNN